MKITKPNITEGEWIVSKSGNVSFEKAVVSKNDGGSICHITDWSKSNLNAKAISAVPDMIDALIIALPIIKDHWHEMGATDEQIKNDDIVIQLKNALTKAGCTYE